MNKQNKKLSRQLLLALNRELFYFSSLILLIFCLLELIFPYIILAYFNLNYLLFLVILSGIILLFIRPDKTPVD